VAPPETDESRLVSLGLGSPGRREDERIARWPRPLRYLFERGEARGVRASASAASPLCSIFLRSRSMRSREALQFGYELVAPAARLW